MALNGMSSGSAGSYCGNCTVSKFVKEIIIKFFKLSEVVDKTTFETYGEACWQFFVPVALTALDDLREYFGSPVTVNNWHLGGQFQYRGYRPPECTEGAPGSYHRQGKAFDLDIRGYTAKQARQIIMANKDDELLKHINRLEDNVSWIHFDIGKVPEGKERVYLFKA